MKECCPLLFVASCVFFFFSCGNTTCLLSSKIVIFERLWGSGSYQLFLRADVWPLRFVSTGLKLGVCFVENCNRTVCNAQDGVFFNTKTRYLISSCFCSGLSLSRDVYTFKPVQKVVLDAWIPAAGFASTRDCETSERTMNKKVFISFVTGLYRAVKLGACIFFLFFCREICERSVKACTARSNYCRTCILGCSQLLQGRKSLGENTNVEFVIQFLFVFTGVRG